MFLLLLLLTTTHCSTTPLRQKQLYTLFLHPNLFKSSLFIPFQEVPISLESFLTVSSHPIQGRPTFRLALGGWLTRTIFVNRSSLICRTWPSHLNLSVIIALENAIKPHFSYSLLFKIWSVKRTPKKSTDNFSGKHLGNPPPFFRAPTLQNYTWPM